MTIRKYVILPQVFISVHRRSCDVTWITGSSVFSHKEAFLCLSAFHSFARPVSIALSLSFSQIRLCSSHAIGHRAVNRSGTLIRVTFIQAHAPVASHTISFFSPSFWNSSVFWIHTPKKLVKMSWVQLPVRRMDRWVCPLLIVSLTHRPFMWLWGGWPLPSSASHPHPRGSHSTQAWLGGSWSSFVLGGRGILSGGCQGCDCVRLYFPRKEMGGRG